MFWRVGKASWNSLKVVSLCLAGTDEFMKMRLICFFQSTGDPAISVREAFFGSEGEEI